jgi:hypothetical protein
MALQCVECDKFIQARVDEPLCDQCAEKVETEFKLEPVEPDKKLKCYFRSNVGYMAEEYYESKTFEAIRRRNQLRKHGYGATINKLGYTTVSGRRIDLTHVSITASEHDDTKGIPISNTEVINGCKIQGIN